MGKRKAQSLAENRPKKKSRQEKSKSTSSTSMVAELLQKVQQVFRSHANSKDASQMKKYMRGQFEFFGIKSPQRRELTKEFLRKKLDNKQIREFVRALWAMPEREGQYVGMDYLRKHRELLLEDGFTENLAFAEDLITTKSWWDTVDLLACHLVGGLVRKYHTEGKQAMQDWIEHENMWLRRSAILHQLSYKRETDSALLFRFCTARAHEKEFFIQKSIGWALREYARTDSASVREFLKENKKQLSKLSYKEASKHLIGI